MLFCKGWSDRRKPEPALVSARWIIEMLAQQSLLLQSMMIIISLSACVRTNTATQSLGEKQMHQSLATGASFARNRSNEIKLK